MTKKIKSKKLSFGGVALATPFAARGMVSIAGSVAGGTMAAGSEELSQVHAQMLLEGTAARGKKDLQILLDSWGATLEFAASFDRLRFAARVPARHAGALLGLVAEILREPAFPREELAILKQRERSALEMEMQDTREQSRIALGRLLYKKGHPSYPESTQESKKALERITVASLRALHERAHGARSLIVSCAGDLPPARAFALAEKHFKTLPAGKAAKPTAIRPAARGAAGKAVVPIAHKASIDYMAGVATGITNARRDYPALLLAMQVLGNPGGFTGRLMRTVREEEGLTYGVYAYAQGFSHNADGVLSVWGTFAPQLFAQGRAAIAREIQKLVEQGIDADELKRHAALFAARAKVGFSNSSSIARIVHDTVADRKPLSYIDDLPKRILGLNAAAVNKAIQKYLIPKKMSESAAGPVDKKAFSS